MTPALLSYSELWKAPFQDKLLYRRSLNCLCVYKKGATASAFTSASAESFWALAELEYPFQIKNLSYRRS